MFPKRQNIVPAVDRDQVVNCKYTQRVLELSQKYLNDVHNDEIMPGL